MPYQSIQSSKQITGANNAQMSQALLIQAYANSVKGQPNVNFSGFKNLGTIETEINTGLGKAQAHADNYLNVIQPSLIANVTNIGNYYALQHAVPSTLPPGATVDRWVSTLNALKGQSQKYEEDAKNVVRSLQGLHNNLSDDSAAFSQVVLDLNTAVNGDNGVLAGINDQLSSIQSKIDGAIAGAVLSGLAIVGGAFMIAVGGIADFVTAGASTPLVYAGVAVVLAGVAGGAGATYALVTLNNQKSDLLTQKSQLNSEVNLAQGMGSAYQSLSNQVKAAVDAASAMQNAWNFLSNDLDSLVGDLDSGITNTGDVRQLFLTAANDELPAVMSDINTIKGQMSGVHVVTDKTLEAAATTALQMAGVTA